MGTSDQASTVEAWVVGSAHRAVAARRRRPLSPLTRVAAAHWLALLNIVNGLLFAGTVLAPWLRAEGYERAAAGLYGFYRLQCPQRPSHSWFLWGEQMGMEQRMVALNAAWLLAGVAFLVLRRRWPPLSTAALVLLSLPMLLDLATQMAGLRDGSGWSRATSGGLFAVASGAWSFPRVNVGMMRMRRANTGMLPSGSAPEGVREAAEAVPSN